jgi:hypothetical protein
MSFRSALVTVLACFVGTVVAIASLDRICTWLVDGAGGATRTALILSNAPWFDARTASATAAPPSIDPPRHRGSRMRPPSAPTHENWPE